MRVKRSIKLLYLFFFNKLEFMSEIKVSVYIYIYKIIIIYILLFDRH